MSKKRRDYKAEYARRIARGHSRRISRAQARGHPRPDELSVSTHNAPREIEDDRLQRALRVLRQQKSLAAAAKAARISPERLRHIAKSKGAITKRDRRWIIEPSLARRMPLFSRGRAIEVTVAGESASKVGAYMDAVGKFLVSNDRAVLIPFISQSATDIAGKVHPFETNPNALYRLSLAGEATFEQVYRIVV
jgi:hypothetical protein